MKTKTIKDIVNEERFCKTLDTVEIGRHNMIKFFENFNLKGLTNSEILSKYQKFHTEYNGLVDLKLDGGLGLMNKYPDLDSKSDEEKEEIHQEYLEAIVGMLRADEDETKCRPIYDL